MPTFYVHVNIFTPEKSWLNYWQRVIPLFTFPTNIYKNIYTTNAIEFLKMSLRKVLKNHWVFPTDEAAMKIVYLALGNVSKKWTMPNRDWKVESSFKPLCH